MNERNGLEYSTFKDVLITLKYALKNFYYYFLCYIKYIKDLIFFIFSKPKYKIGQTIKYWGTKEILAYERNWEYCHYSYKVSQCSLTLSEGLIDFYMNGDKNGL